MNKKYGWCFVGAGMISGQVAPQILKHSDNSFIASCWNRTHEKAIKFSKRFKCSCYKDLEDAVMDERVDLIYLCLNHHVHYEYLKKLIKYHKPILCEKPFTLNSKETKEIIDLAKKENTFVSEAMWTWHNEPALKSREWVLNKEVGDIKSVEITYSNPFMPLLPLKRLKDINLGGGALLDSGIYPISYAYHLFGYPKKIELLDFKFIKDVDSKETIKFIYDGFECLINVNLVGKFKEEVIIKGSDGLIKVPNFHYGNKANLIKNNRKIKFVSNSKGYYPEFRHTELDFENGLIDSTYNNLKSTYDCMKILDEIRNKMNLKYPNELK